MPRIERLNRLIARMDRDGRAEPEPRTLEDWVNAVLQNDELATNEELIEFFMSEGPMGREEAEDAVSQRGEALRDRHYQVRIGRSQMLKQSAIEEGAIRGMIEDGMEDLWEEAFRQAGVKESMGDINADKKYKDLERQAADLVIKMLKVNEGSEE